MNPLPHKIPAALRPLRLVRRRVRRSPERGGVTVLVATLLGFGVLTGSAALVVDVGMIYAEREELQSGADSAAMVIAEACKAGRCTNATELDAAITRARGYANANAKDARTQITDVCGRWGGWNKPCPPPTGKLSACVGNPPSNGFVEVRVQTQTPTGTTLPPVFARSMPGNADYDGTTVRACSRVRFCVSAAEATYRHTFNGNAGVATITADQPVCAGEKVSLVSYTAPDNEYVLPQFVYDYETKVIGTTTLVNSFTIEVPACYNQVDFVFGDKITALINQDVDFYGPRKIGDQNYPGNRSVGVKAWSHGGTRTCAPRPATTFTNRCDGSMEIRMSNASDANVKGIFEVTVAGVARPLVRLNAGTSTTMTIAAGAGPVVVKDNLFRTTTRQWAAPTGC